MNNSPQQRREVHYSGHVQGVGFRFSVHRLAGGFEVVGFVRNLPDRRVHLVVEGPKSEIDRFVGELSAKMSGFIGKIESDTLAPSGEFRDFEIRY